MHWPTSKCLKGCFGADEGLLRQIAMNFKKQNIFIKIRCESSNFVNNFHIYKMVITIIFHRCSYNISC